MGSGCCCRRAHLEEDAVVEFRMMPRAQGAVDRHQCVGPDDDVDADTGAFAEDLGELFVGLGFFGFVAARSEAAVIVFGFPQRAIALQTMEIIAVDGWPACSIPVGGLTGASSSIASAVRGNRSSSFRWARRLYFSKVPKNGLSRWRCRVHHVRTMPASGLAGRRCRSSSLTTAVDCSSA